MSGIVVCAARLSDLSISQPNDIHAMRVNTLLLPLSIAWLSACQTTGPGGDPEPPPAPLDLSLCNSTAGTLPAHNGLKINRKSALACTQNIQYLIVPAQDACLLSGFGPRPQPGKPNKKHKGVDYQGKGRRAVPVLAAADGTVVINKWREDMGHWIVLDHGEGIYTGYAHLQNASDKLVGMTVNMEETLGMMGDTGSAARGLHLHVEFRKGDLKQPENGGYFALSPFDPYNYPENC